MTGFFNGKDSARLFVLLSSGLIFSATVLQADAVVDTYSVEDQIQPCMAGDLAAPRVLVDISGIESNEGQLRVQVYSDNPEDFLVSGKKVLRVEVPSREQATSVCVTFPEAGIYSLAVLHDKNANGKADIFSEGFGFSNNPKLAFGPPEHEETLFEVEQGVKQMNVALTYYFQLGDKASKRRRRR